MTTDQLGILVNRAASGRLLTEHEGTALREAVAKLQADEAQARRTAGGLMAKVQQLGGQLKTAQAEHADCHTITVDGQTIRVHRVGTLGPVSEIALTELIRAAKQQYAAGQPADAPSADDRFIVDSPRNTGWYWTCRTCGKSGGKFSTDDQALEYAQLDHPQCPADSPSAAR